MKDCIFCDIVKNANDEGQSQSVILYEDDLIIIVPAKGSPVEGYLMIIVKRHINGFAELTSNEIRHVENIINKIKLIYKKHFNIDSILLEHGSTKDGRHPQSIVHAHLHLIPFNFKEEIEKELIRDLQLRPMKSFENIKINENLDYWLYCDPKGKFYESANILNAPRSIFMNLIAKQIDIPLPYEWRTSETKNEYIKEMIEIFKNNNIQ